MKIIGYSESPKLSDFCEVVSDLSQYSHYDFVVDLTNADLVADPTKWLQSDTTIEGYHSDFYDREGNYVPSPKRVPASIMRTKTFIENSGDLSAAMSTSCFSYIPEPLFRIS